MLGVGDWPPHAPALKTMIGLIKLKMPTVPVSQDVPVKYPDKFIIVDRVGGTEIARGKVMEALFAFQCYALDTGNAEQLCEDLLAVLKSAQFTKFGNAQLRSFTLVGAPQNFPDPNVPGRRRWQFSGTFGIS